MEKGEDIMIDLFKNGGYLVNGTELISEEEQAAVEAKLGKKVSKEEAKKGTIAYGILKNHNKNNSMDALKINFNRNKNK